MKKKIIMMLVVSTMIIGMLAQVSCGTNTKQATVTKCYQPLVSGMVHTYIQVRFDDNSTADVILPDSDNVWSQARQAARGQKKVTVKESKGKWVFVKFVN